MVEAFARRSLNLVARAVSVSIYSKVLHGMLLRYVSANSSPSKDQRFLRKDHKALNLLIIFLAQSCIRSQVLSSD